MFGHFFFAFLGISEGGGETSMGATLVVDGGYTSGDGRGGVNRPKVSTLRPEPLETLIKSRLVLPTNSRCRRINQISSMVQGDASSPMTIPLTIFGTALRWGCA